MERHRRLRADLALAEKALEREREAQKSRASRPQRSSAIKSQSAKVTRDIPTYAGWGFRDPSEAAEADERSMACSAEN